MEATIAIGQGQSQALLITPQFQQSLKILQCGIVELGELIEKELAENPALEMDEGGEESSEENSVEGTSLDNIEDNFEGEFDWTSSSTSAADDRPCDVSTSEIESLQRFLFSQLIDLELSIPQKKLVAFLIGNLDEDGYLRIPLDELIEESNSSIEKVEEAIQTMQSFEPTGVGARDLKECLRIQLEKRGKLDSLAGCIVENHLVLVEKKNLSEIARLENVDVTLIRDALDSLKLLNPFPGRGVVKEETSYASPDVVVKRINGDYAVVLNHEDFPRLRINAYYQDLAKDKGAVDRESRSYLSSKIRGASWLLRCIDQRQHTIRKISEAIVKRQKKFFDVGSQGLKPLALREVAEDIGVHESTVSRAVANKFIKTPQGVFELKHFFTPGIKAKGVAVTTSSIKDRIRNIIETENPSAPISDQRVVQLLKDSKIVIARRTVTKYREALGIASSTVRRREDHSSSTPSFAAF